MSDSDLRLDEAGHFEAEVSLIVRMRTDASEQAWLEAFADLAFSITRTDGVVEIVPGSIEGERKFISDPDAQEGGVTR